MPLNRHLAQGRLLYFTQQPEAINISENNHLRWMAFDDIVQSIIRKNKPYQLTLPHQWALMMPLLQYTPQSITELGLGAGNHLLFTQSLNSPIHHQVIETNNKVIELALRYFSLEKYTANITHQDANAWLSSQLQQGKSITSDWVIFDIYQKAKFRDNSYNQLLSQVINALPSTTILSINFPENTEQEMKFWLVQLAKVNTHHMNFYTVPHFKNQIFHLIPKQPSHTIKQHSILPARLRRYWRTYQLKFGLTAG